MPLLHETKYGTFEIAAGGYDGPWRIDVYVPNDPQRYASGAVQRRIEERRFCAGHDDVSPPHSTYPKGYDARCGSCWLNHPHTEAYHQQQIAST